MLGCPCLLGTSKSGVAMDWGVRGVAGGSGQFSDLRSSQKGSYMVFLSVPYPLDPMSAWTLLAKDLRRPSDFR